MFRVMFLVVLSMALCLSLGVASSVRITDYGGTHYDTMYNTAAMSAAERGMNPIQLCNSSNGKAYSRALMSIIVPNPVQIGGADTAINNTDSVVLNIRCVKDWYSTTVFSQRTTIPCTVFVHLGPEDFLDSSYVPILADSGAVDSTGVLIDGGGLVYGYRPGFTKRHALYLEQLYFAYLVKDSAGASDTIQVALQWWLRLIDEE